MKTNEIARRLYSEEWGWFIRNVIPPWVDGCTEQETAIKEHFANAKEVQRQCVALNELFPHKKSEQDRQCDAIIFEIACKIYELCYELNA